MKEKLLAKFSEIFGDQEGVNVYFAPGRVNLIGEHTDYNGGHVFPSALTIGTYAAARKNKEGIFRFYSMNFENLGMITIPLKDFSYKKEDDWTNYPKGVIWALREKGYEIEEGLDIVYYGNIPNASGLSSSASVEVLTGYILKELFALNIDMVQIALVSQFAENKFNGVNCGIMDQFSIAMGKKDHAIFLDTSNLEYEYAPIKLEAAKIVIACSNKKRGLGDSKYNDRRQECEDALALLKTVVHINSLGELSEEEFEKHKAVIQDEIKIKRAKHAVYENQRTIQAVKALKEGNLSLFGQLMRDSHISLRDDYEVTGLELDILFDAAWEQEGVIGSRMTGAGFGGCTVSIVKEENIDTFVKNVGNIYFEKIGYHADLYVVDIGDGPTTL